MNIRPYLKAAEKFTTDNSPLILTAIGAAGVLTTAILAAKGGYQASERLRDERVERWTNVEGYPQVDVPSNAIFTPKEKLAMTWTYYAPACGAAAVTIAAVVASNRVSTKRAAAMAAAYSLSVEAFDEYKDKVKAKLGERKETIVRDEIAQDRVANNPPTDDNVIVVTHDGDQIFQDSWSGRYFKSNHEAVRRAVNELNHVVNSEGSATLTDFYGFLGLAKTRESDEIGWAADKLLDVYFSPVLHDNGKTAVMAIEYYVTPTRSFFRTK